MATTPVLLRLKDDTAAALRAYAATRGGKGALSTVAEELLRAGLGLIDERRAETTMLPALENVMRRVMAEQAQVDADRASADAAQARADTERLAGLLVKAVREASVGRWLMLALIERVRGRAAADEDRERAFTAAAKVLRGRETSGEGEGSSDALGRGR